MFLIVDLDGTVANIDHRLPHIHKTPPDWDTFHSLVKFDLPHYDVIELVQALAKSKELKVVYISARMERCRADTMAWLARYHLPVQGLLLRQEGDFSHDHDLKRGIAEWCKFNKHNVYMVLEDRDTVVAMWRSLGMRCLQVAKGDF